MGVWHQGAKCRPVRWIKSVHSLLCWFECKQKNTPLGMHSFLEPRRSLISFPLHLFTSPVHQIQTQKQGLNVLEVYTGLISSFNILLCINNRSARAQQQRSMQYCTTGTRVACSPWRHPRRSISHSVVDSRQLFNGQLRCTVLSSLGRNATNHTFAAGIK